MRKLYNNRSKLDLYYKKTSSTTRYLREPIGNIEL